MTANDPTPSERENVSAESYPQYCLKCSSEWRILGEVGEEHRKCPKCQMETPTGTFFKWWVSEQFDTNPRVEIEVSPEVSAAVDELEDVLPMSREEILLDVVVPQWEYVEQGEKHDRVGGNS